MIFDEIVLHDFGVYGGRQSIDLTPQSPNKPVILFGGLNGGGKTTLLDAFQLVLFGSAAKCSNRNEYSYSDFLKRCIHRNATKKEAALELEFRHTVDGNEHTFRLHRSWSVVSEKARERFEVFKDGEKDQSLTDNWQSQVEDFIPASIAHLFFFDGEKIEGYAEKDSSAALIKSGIQSLLGLDIVDRLFEDLNVLERRKVSDAKGGDEGKEITSIEKTLEELAARSEVLKKKQQETDLRIRECQKKETLERERYISLGGSLLDRREELEKKYTNAKSDWNIAQEDVRDLARGALPLALLSSQLDELIELDNTEQKTQKNLMVLDVMLERDEKIIAHLQKLTNDAIVSQKVKTFLDADRESRKSEASVDPVLLLSDTARKELHIVASQLSDLIVETREKTRCYHEAKESFENAEIEFQSIPEEDAVAELVARLNDIATETDRLEKSKLELKIEIAQVHRQVEQQNYRLKALVDKNVESQLEGDNVERVLRHSQKVRTTLKKFHELVIRRHVRHIETLVLESYQQLLRKSSLVGDLRIDPETFELTLYTPDKVPLPQERLSAGERQLLAVSLLWGMGKASSRSLPTIVDTPLGRLDSKHRTHLVERYFPFASHQTFLLSTDEEINEGYRSMLQPWIGRQYHISFEDKLQCSRVEEGYFDGNEAA